MSKLRIAPRGAPTQPEPAAAPLLTLDQLEILSTSPDGKASRVDLNTEDLAQLIAYGEETSTSGLDVELRLAGLADLLQATYGADQTPGRDAIYFIAETLVDIRARLQTHRDKDRYRVRVVPGALRKRSSRFREARRPRLPATT
jgi:hypothetical protein